MTRPEGSRTGFGALHLATHVNGRLVYAGRAGSGFDEGQLRSLYARLDAMRIPSPAFVEGEPNGRGHVWVRPELVCEVRYREWADDGHLRQPVFLRLREDLAPSACVRDAAAEHAQEAPAVAAPAPPPEAATSTRTVHLTNLDKVFWPEDGYTKGDLLDYYRRIAPALLPYLRDRPLMLTRFPDGIHGKSFFQKDAPQFMPGWLRTERMYSEDAGREVDQIICEDVESLLYLVNLGTIPLHVWSSRYATLQAPDWCVIDLDPKEAPFSDVVTVARAVHELCDEIGLPSYPKTSGASGLHVMIPLGRQTTHAESRILAQLLSTVIAQRLPEIATLTRVIGNRGGRVYLDTTQNGHGKLIACQYAVRPVVGASVSTPLEWREVNAKLDPKKHTIKTVPKRVAARGDPLRGILEAKPDLPAALTRLQEVVAARPAT
jgi:bifunctional non-homologous end joining protein LigD